jgi:hypothetical protein
VSEGHVSTPPFFGAVLKMGRKAKVWKGHEELINIGTAVGAGTLSLKEQLHVKISLRYMRKAHTTDRRREDDR